MNQLHIKITTPQNNNNHRLNGKFLIEYYLQGKLRRIAVKLKRVNHDILIQHANTKIRIYTVPIMALRPCFPKIPENYRATIIETLSAENNIIETLLHEIGLRMATQLRFPEVFTHKTKFDLAEELYTHDANGFFEFKAKYMLQREIITS